MDGTFLKDYVGKFFGSLDYDTVFQVEIRAVMECMKFMNVEEIAETKDLYR